jgi:preprotein translocase SecE subunit
MSEIRKVNWPDQETARNLTFLVVGISVVLGLALGGIDFVLQKVFEAMT